MIIPILKGKGCIDNLTSVQIGIFRHSICLVVPPGSESLFEHSPDGDVITDFDIREKSLLDSGELKRSIYYFKAEENNLEITFGNEDFLKNEYFIQKNYSSFKMTTFNSPIGGLLMKITDELYRNALTNRNRFLNVTVRNTGTVTLKKEEKNVNQIKVQK